VIYRTSYGDFDIYLSALTSAGANLDYQLYLGEHPWARATPAGAKTGAAY